MKILVTGSKGFIGKNLIEELKHKGYTDLLTFDREDDMSLLENHCKEAEFIFHLAGVNRPETVSEFETGNTGLTEDMISYLNKYNAKCPLMISSSIQAELDNPYGKSKRQSELAVFNYGETNNTKVYVYRFQNVFGKWSRPNYNSVVATFCHNISHDLPIRINNPDAQLSLIYIDDIISELLNALNSHETKNDEYCIVNPVYEIRLGELSKLIYMFKESRITKELPNMNNEFVKKLYSTYLSYLPVDQFSYPLKMNSDYRGSFTEFIRTPDRGQVSVNISKPGITKGNHWHHTKNEKFLVVSGRGVIRFRQIESEEIIEYFVSGEKLEVVDIPVGYTHNIENLGTTDMVTIMWVNECFDPEKPDTYFLEV